MSGPGEAAFTEEEIAGSPLWYPLEMLPDASVRLVRLDEAAYLGASFLDQRILALGYRQASCAASLLEGAAARLAPSAHYILHTGHAGSTLISRLVGAHPGFFSLREPALLREFAGGGQPSVALPLRAAQALLSRTWRPAQRAVIKVTSFVSEIATALLGGPERPAAVLMCTSALAYLRGILAGANSRLECRQLAPARLERLAQRFEPSGWRPQPRSEGEYIAMSWLCEISALQRAALGLASQVLWVDFDVFLNEPAAGLDAIFRALGKPLAAADVEAILVSPLMRQYSKAPEHPYDAALRREVLASADVEHAAEIRRGMVWLQAASDRDTTIAAAITAPLRARPAPP